MARRSNTDRSVMKQNPWLVPVLAALVVGAWIVSRRSAAEVLEHEITVLRERIQQARLAGESAGSQLAAGDLAKKGKDRAIHWKEVASSLKHSEHGPADMRAMMRMQRLLMDLSAEELCAQLDEIAALDLEEPVKRQLESMILGSLAEKDPKLALEYFAKRPQNEEFGSWLMSSALEKLAEKEAGAATAWLDQRIASGAFESRKLNGENPELMNLERALAGALLKNDPDAAIARVKRMPENQRGELFRLGGYIQLGEEQHASYVRFVREAAPQKDIATVLATRAGALVRNGSYEKVDSFIATAGASPEEKEQIVTEVMNHRGSSDGADPLDIEEFGKARAWAATQAPDVVDKATGEALAKTLWTQKGDFNKAAELAEKFGRESGKDETLAAFLMSDPVRIRSRTPAIEWANKIEDPARRQQVLDYLNGKVKER